MLKVTSAFVFVAATTLQVSLVEGQIFEKKTAQGGIEFVKSLFENQGYVVLKDFFDEERPMLRELKNSSKTLFNSIFREMYDKGYTKFPEHSRVFMETDDHGENEKKRVYAMPEGRENGFQEIVMRNPGRYEISLAHYEMEGPSLEPLVQKLRGVLPALFRQRGAYQTELNLQKSLIMSTVDSAEQAWHADGEHLDMSEHLPVHCLNVFIPLVNVPKQKGPTEVYSGSHYKTRQPSPMSIDTTKMIPYGPELSVGDILIFDYRLLHRGKPNRSKSHRPVLVFTFSEPSFTDVYNWPKRSLKD